MEADLQQIEQRLLENPRFALMKVSLADGMAEIIIDKQFPPTDPWSISNREFLMADVAAGMFDGICVTELGLGSGINLATVGANASELKGTDIDPDLTELAKYNLAKILPSINTNFAVDGAQYYVLKQPSISGAVIMCLPQSLGAGSETDVYELNGSTAEERNLLAQYGYNEAAASYFHTYGMGLNYLALWALSIKATPETKVYTILNNRIPDSIVPEMLAEAGWQVEHQQTTTVQHDPDTKLGWMYKFAKKTNFFGDPQATEPISFTEVTDRMQAVQAEANGDINIARQLLQVYHNVTVYRLGKINN